MSSEVRKFETGATRDSNSGKLDYEGFDSPLVNRRYAEYMHEHRYQSDGTMRAADNWQKGIPKQAYMESLVRHVEDAKLHWDGYGDIAVDPNFESTLCAILFNVKGLLFELIKERRGERTIKAPSEVPGLIVSKPPDISLDEYVKQLDQIEDTPKWVPAHGKFAGGIR